jgi:hypothetical protein
LLLGVVMTIPALPSPDGLTLSDIVVRFTLGAVAGFAIQAWSDLRTRQRSGRDDDEIYEVRQERRLTILRGTQGARDLCREAMRSIDTINTKTIKEKDQLLVGRTQWTWESFGIIVQMHVAELSDTLAEVTINTRPLFRTTAVDYGEGCEVADKLVRYLRQNDAALTKKLLNEGAQVIRNASRRPLDQIFIDSGERSNKHPSGK